MYVTISAQKIGGKFPTSVGSYVDYLEKENESILGSESPENKQDLEHFFNQYGERIGKGEVIREIDSNTSKLKKKEPKFYSITINPSQRELRHLENSAEALKKYTKSLMEQYVQCFHREIDGRPLCIEDIKYYAKLEHKRYFKGTDREVKENQKYADRILEIKNELRKWDHDFPKNNVDIPKTDTPTVAKKQKELYRELYRLEREAPHKVAGQRIVQGMEKPGYQSHIHIIVSRKDASNSVSLSPGSKYRASEVTLNGKQVKRGFDRDRFFKGAEKLFDKTFGYQRNYVETYKARKTFKRNPTKFFAKVLKLPENERALAVKLLKHQHVPVVKIPTNKAQLAVEALKQLKKGITKGINASSIGY
ncbi:mobilization protein [Galbibacter sp. BG1]|uniref:MobB family relaxase n=1 Tax=Galbibacter sp. BG1 TaxID=1170699 RepID=UPI0015BB4F18|nr:MobB family relaxase [Galbibacter sp. BG1]QLE01978.1 mobilization protein [Galbibacter sp. BG1]